MEELTVMELLAVWISLNLALETAPPEKWINAIETAIAKVVRMLEKSSEEDE